ncbi:MAG: c-type cytochrome domain-containing protein [Flavobacteriaceae bacterium]
MVALEFTTFLGRFHPLFVHLPIGFILLAILLEWWESFNKTQNPSQLIPVAWFIGGLSAFAAAICGWYLGETGLYEEENLFLHRWLGVFLVPISFIGWWIKRKPNEYPKQVQNGFNILLIVLLSIEGHKGGNLTHGETYLTEFAPEPIRKLLGGAKDSTLVSTFVEPDSVIIYHQLIAPIFEVKCISCHGNEVKRGALNMSHPDSMQLGGDGGAVLVKGSAAQSELFRRITLPQKNNKFMPPTPNVLTYDEIKTIEWWIEQGASFEDRVSDVKVPDNMKPLLLRRFGLNTEKRPWYEKVQLAALDSAHLINLRRNGFTLKTLGGKNQLLDVSYSGTNLSAEKMALLEPASKHITWLSLSETNLENEWLSIVSDFSNLTRLELDRTSISDEGIGYIKGLHHLEVLNLYASKVTDSVLPSLGQMPKLRRVYLFETNVTSQAAKGISEINSQLSIIVKSK